MAKRITPEHEKWVRETKSFYDRNTINGLLAEIDHLRKERDARFNQGYACAVACIVSGHGESTETSEALEANGMTSMETLREMGVDPFDRKVLRRTIKQMETKKRWLKRTVA